jgi:hypothetical protein
LLFLQVRKYNLYALDLRNGNNNQFDSVWTSGNPNLNCISVDDSIYSTNNWTVSIFSFPVIDSQHYFSNDCNLIQNVTTSEVYILNNIICVGDTVFFIDASSSFYPNTVSRWWWYAYYLAPQTQS